MENLYYDKGIEEESYCLTCGEVFMIEEEDQEYCSRLCKTKQKTGLNEKVILPVTNKHPPRECMFCKKEFNADLRQLYCSTDCRAESRRKIYYKSKTVNKQACPSCNKTFISKGAGNRYCSYECQRHHRRAKLPSTKQWKVLSEYVYERDMYKCVSCKDDKGSYHVHHKLPLSLGGTNEYDNLELLCERCHGERHTEINARLKERREKVGANYEILTNNALTA